MSKRDRKHIKAILEWLRTEIESHYEFEKSSLKAVKNAGWGRNGFYFNFESSQIGIEIWYWNTGVFNVWAFEAISEDLLIDRWYVPDDYDKSNYPEKSEAIFRRKIKELLIGLHHKNRNIPTNLPPDI